MPVRNGNPGNGRTTTTIVASVRKIARVTRADRLRVEGRDGSAEELDIETGEEQTTVGRTRRKDGGCQNTEESGRVT